MASVLSDFPFIQRISHNPTFSRRVGLGLLTATITGTIATVIVAIASHS